MSTKPLFLVLLCVNLLGQSQKEPSKETTIKVSVRRVPVDVIVTDSKGHPVRDLKVSDFQVFEDAKPREITGFSLEESATAQTTKVPLQPGLLANYTDATAATTDLTVILLDELNTAIGDAAYARFRLEKMLVDPTLKQETVALFVLNRELIKLQDFTQDPTVLLSAFRKHKPFMPALGDDEFAGLDPSTNAALSAAMSPEQRALNQSAIELFQQQVGQLNWNAHTTFTLAALRRLADALRDRPGRKRLIWISSGFPYVFQQYSFGQSQGSLYDAIRQTSASLTSARIAIYPVDARGLVPYRQAFRAGSAGRTALITPADSLGPMKEIANATGGKVYFNRNDIDGAAEDAMRDGDAYYALTYRLAEDEFDSRFHKLEVKVHRPGVKVRHRGGFYAAAAEAKTTSGMLEAALDPFIRSELQFAAAGARVTPDAARLLVILNPRALRLPEKPAETTRYMEVLCVEGIGTEKPRTTKLQQVEIKVEAERFTSASTQGLPFFVNVPLAGTSNRLRIILRDAETGQIGTLDVPLQRL